MAALAACTKEENIKQDYLYISCDSYYFSSSQDTVAIKIESSEEWTAIPSSEWLSVEKTGEDSLLVISSENNDINTRSSSVSIKSGDRECIFSAEQFGKNFKGRFEDLTYMYHMNYPVASKNCKYILGVIQGSKDGVYAPIIVNTATGERTILEESDKIDGPVGISDDAKVMIFSKTLSQYSIYENGKYKPITVPDNYTAPSVGGISSDGSVWVGWAHSKIKKTNVPIKWVNGEAIELEMPEETSNGDIITRYAGVLARDCSADGSVIYGSEWCPSTFGVIYWKDDRMYYPGKDFYDGTTISKTASYYALSRNGKYLAADKNGIPVLIDTDTYDVTFFDQCNEMVGITASDNGDIFLATPTIGIFSGYVINNKENTEKPIDKWFMDEYGILMGSNRIIYSVSPDKNIFFGIKATPTINGNYYTTWYLVNDVEKAKNNLN